MAAALQTDDAQPDRNPATPTGSGHKPTVVHFEEIPPVACPCGLARRAFAADGDIPFTVHLTEISCDARLHYHRQMTEVYLVLECQAGAALQLDQEQIPLAPHVCVKIPPGVRHRAIGAMRVLIIAYPKFDPADEWFDE